MSAVITPSVTPDLAAVKGRQQIAWSAGDYAVIGTTLQIVGESLCEAIDIRPGERVLDVAAGNGNATLAAARRGADVLSTDYVPALLERGRRRAEAEGLPVRFEPADAEKLPMADASFDVVLSTFGVMFTPDQDRAGSELMRVCRPGGRIGLANWTPGSLIGEVFKTLGRHLPPPAGVRSPALWGTEDRLRELFARRLAGLAVTRRHFVFRYASAQAMLDTFRTWYGPIHKAFGALGEEAGRALEADLIALIERFNRSGGTVLVAPGEYLEVVATLR